MPESEHHSQRDTQTLAGKSRPKSARQTKHILTPVPPYPGFSDFSGLLSPELIPETALPSRSKDQREGNPFLSYKSHRQAVDSDGDVLMTDASSEKVVAESSVLSELDKRLSQLEFAKKSWEFEVKEVKAKLNKNAMHRLDALQDFTDSRYRHSSQRQIEG